MENAFQVTVITAVYKVEPFLREAIDSVIAQNIGFAEHVQFILVDDGSPDGCGAICDEYAARYPHNIEVIHKENGGVSSARNAALPRAKGRFINFMDADDKLSPETLREVCAFFDRHLAETDIVSIPMVFFDGKQGSHLLNYKYNRGSRVVDLDREWTCAQLSLSSAFVKRECFAELQFDTRLRYAEDAKLVQRILSHKCTLGLVATGTYLYRRRSEGEQSAIQMTGQRPDWYLPYMRYFCLDTLQFYKDKYGYVPRFIQYTLMYDLQWRIRQEKIPAGVIGEEEKAQYLALIHEALSQIDDGVIAVQRHLSIEYRLFAMKLKYGCLPERIVRENDLVLRFGADTVFKQMDCNCYIEMAQLHKDAIMLDGRIALFPLNGKREHRIEAVLDGKAYPCEAIDDRRPLKALGETVLTYAGFRVTLPLEPKSGRHTLWFVMHTDGVTVRPRAFSFGSFAPIGREYTSAYYLKNGWRLTLDNERLLIDAQTPGMRRRSERAFLRELWTKNRNGARKAVLARRILPILRFFRRRPLWLISDRAAKAGDNGEAFFRYMRANHREIDARFVINADCADYAAMKAVGPVLKRGTLKQKLYLLLSDYILSSQGEVDIYNPFAGRSVAFRDILADVRFVFLQHGVIMHDLSNWLDHYNKNIYGFVTSARPEYLSIINGNYHYGEREVWLTGLPRFDRLYHAEEKIITIMPTWRRYLMGQLNTATGDWTALPAFAESEYLRFYNGLLSDERLFAAVKRYGYRIDFLPHPNLQTHLDFFVKNDSVTYLGREVSYRDIYAKSKLVITDYSSAVFDFAYLRKPVLYTQFDAEEFFSGKHTSSRGYFDYARDGFGEVTYDLDSTVDRIIEYMENDCRLKDVYRERIDNFFAFDDQNNCARVYDRIREREGETV